MYKVLNFNFPNLPKEEIEQQYLCKWLERKNIFYFATNNENNQSFENRQRAKKIAAKAKSMGVKRGVSDMVIFTDKKILFIELKRQRPILKDGRLGTPKNKATDEQKEFITISNTYDYCDSFVAYGCNKAIEIINRYVT